MNTNSTDFACLVTGFLTDYLPLQRCYSKNTILSYRDTLKLFLRFLSEAKGISPNSFHMKDFKRELVIEFLEWYRQKGAGISAANQRLAAIKAFSGYAQFESIECIAPLQDVSGIKVKKASPREVSFITVAQMAALINLPDINTYTGFRHRVILTLLYDSGCRVQELCDITIADVSLNSTSTVRLQAKVINTAQLLSQMKLLACLETISRDICLELSGHNRSLPTGITKRLTVTALRISLKSIRM